MARHRTGAAIARWKTKNGKRVKQWYACVTYFENGKRVYKYGKPQDNTKTAARELAKKILADLDSQGPKAFNAANMTFVQLADYFQSTYLIDPQYVDGRKVAGYRGKYIMELNLKILRDHFGKQKIKGITYGDLVKFKAVRLKTPAVFGKNTRGTTATGKEVKRQRAIGTVHKELSLLRRVLNVAVQEGWITRNPFTMGDSLINPGDEKQRERIITKDEEERLLATCTGTRAHLKPILVCAIDTGMRKGEIIKLRWSDIDFENRRINIQAFNTKTIRERHLSMTSRLTEMLKELWEKSNHDPDELVFGITTSPKKGFAKSRKEAGIPDVTIHDLRHTNATRLVSKGLPIAEVARVLGHTQIRTTYRYVNADMETADRARDLLEDFNKEETKPEVIN